MKVFRLPLFLALGCALNISPSFAAPVITATKDDNTPAGVRKVVGNQITYTIQIGNTAAPGAGNDATGVSFSDPDPANTSFVSVNSTPLARNDTYAAIGNVQIVIPGPGLIANDNDADDAINAVNPGVAVGAPFPTTSANGGFVSASANGGFTYNPAPGFTGTDTFTYTIVDGEGSTNTATVTIQVTGTIWFINANAGAGGDGRILTLFNTIARVW